MRESTSPSWFNPHEASLVKDYVKDLLEAGLGIGWSSKLFGSMF